MAPEPRYLARNTRCTRRGITSDKFETHELVLPLGIALGWVGGYFVAGKSGTLQSVSVPAIKSDFATL